MSNLRFKKGDLARVIRSRRDPKTVGKIVTVCAIGFINTTFPIRSDYGILIDDDKSSHPSGLWGISDEQLAPYPDPSDWDSFERETGLPRLTGKVKEENHV